MCVALPAIGGQPKVEATNTSPKPVLPKIGSPAPDATAILPKIGAKK
jgi:hypothetical protein